MATKIRQSNLDPTVISGQTELAELAAETDVLLVFDTSAGTLKKIKRSNIRINTPTLSSVSPTTVQAGDGTGNHTFTITGTNFVAGTTASLKNTSGASVSFASQTLDSSTQITGVIAKSTLVDSGEPYDVVVTNSEGSVTLTDQINVNAQPVFATSAGSLGSLSEQTTITPINIIASDPESAGNVVFDILTGGLPAGLSSTTVNEDGVSKFRISGTLSTNVTGPTTTTFTLRASDVASNTSTRAFSITENPAGTESFTSDGTFSVPTGITAVNVLVVAGGGGGGPDNGGGAGAGGLIFRPGFPVTPGGTVAVTVGDAGQGSHPTGNTVGGDSTFGTLTAKGGGKGGAGGQPGGNGGSGGGANGHNNSLSAGTALQPTQPGDSGAYGFGTNGGTADGNNGGTRIGGGGGGAGQAGSPGPNGFGGNGKAYTIADGTTPVYYAGGGGGGALPGQPTGSGGQGGGGAGSNATDSSTGGVGQANKGGGGGGGGNGRPGGNGGKGIVIVNY